MCYTRNVKKAHLALILIGIAMLGAGITLFFNQDQTQDSNPMELSTAELAELENKSITLVGTAENGKAGAVLTGGPTAVYISGLEHWPEEYLGNKVSVTGTLILNRYAPPPEGVIVQEIVGDYYSVSDASWSLVK